MTNKEKAVMDFIDENFDQQFFTIVDFPLFPAGKRVIDKSGQEILVYFDLLYDKVTFIEK